VVTALIATSGAWWWWTARVEARGAVVRATFRPAGLVILVVVAFGLVARAQPSPGPALPPDMQTAIDNLAADALTRTGAPSASLAVVRDGAIAFTRAYGAAQVEPRVAATPDMRYSIGSVSKQFTATAILLLAEDGKLTLDDAVGKWLPTLTRANEVTIRQILSMTSGYQDYWPQDYVMPGMLVPVTAQAILDEWARKPLDFEPGTKWQYSNTNYVAAGLIVEKASGTPLVDFLQARVFTPLRMTSVSNIDLAPLGPGEPARHLRYALGPLRPAPKEGKGWLFAAGELAMTARDLALWDIATIDQKVLKPASYREMQKEVMLTTGAGSRYGLGVSIGTVDGRRRVSHTGEVSGFTASNDIYPDQRAAIVVFANLDATSATSQISSRIASLLFPTPGGGATDPAVAQARAIFEGLQRGEIDRTLFTSNANAYFTPQALADFASSLGPLGAPRTFVQQGQSLRGGMTFRSFRVVAGTRTLVVTTFTMPDGKLEQYQIAAAD
jgi:CubicO group peptidase (beta-lactamase class C family)